MSGKPRRRALIAELEHRTRDYFEVPTGEASTATHLGYVVEYIRNGGTMKELAEEMSVTVGFQVFGGQITTYLCEAFPEEAEHALINARARGAFALVDDSISIVDAPALDSVDVSRAASRARVRQWTAERFNRRELGAPSAPSVTISVGTLHLDALRAPREAELVRPSHLLQEAQDVVITEHTPGAVVVSG